MIEDYLLTLSYYADISRVQYKTARFKKGKYSKKFLDNVLAVGTPFSDNLQYVRTHYDIFKLDSFP